MRTVLYIIDGLDLKSLIKIIRSDVTVAIKLQKGIEEFKNIPVLLISASNHIASLQSDCEAEDHIKKPFDLKELVCSVNKYVL